MLVVMVVVACPQRLGGGRRGGHGVAADEAGRPAAATRRPVASHPRGGGGRRGGGGGGGEHARRARAVRRRGLAVHHRPVGGRSDAFLVDFGFLFGIPEVEPGVGGCRPPVLAVGQRDAGRQVEGQVRPDGVESHLPVAGGGQLPGRRPSAASQPVHAAHSSRGTGAHHRQHMNLYPAHAPVAWTSGSPSGTPPSHSQS